MTQMHRQTRGIMRFIDKKTETLNLRVSPTFKRVLMEVAQQEHRSMVNMLEVFLSDYCDRNCVGLVERKATFLRGRSSSDPVANEGASA